ncbi:hypothetical protein Tco_1093905, partial [Tanacetum coccineum]
GFGIVRSIGQTLDSNSGIMEKEPDIKNMTLNEYLEYEAEKERRSWRNVRSKSSLTRNEEVDIESMTVAEYNLYVAKQDVDNISDLEKEEAQEGDGDDEDIYDMLNVTMVDEEANFNPTKDIEELERLLTKDPHLHFTEMHLYRLLVMVDVARGSRLGA